MSVIETVAAHTPCFYLVKREQAAFLLLYRPYAPYVPNGAGYVELDAYYPASNALYRLTRTLEAELQKYGAKPYFGDLRKLFRESNIGVIMNNTLLAIPPHGTRVCLNALELDAGAVQEERLPSGTVEPICNGCGQCFDACPRNALDETGIKAARCFRTLLNTPEESVLTGLKGNVGGCDACQRACPFDPKPIPMPPDLKKLLRFDTFAEMLQGGKRGLEPLRPYLGSNYLRPYRLSMLFLNAVEAKGEYAYAEYLTRSQHEDVRAYAQRLVRMAGER